MILQFHHFGLVGFAVAGLLQMKNNEFISAAHHALKLELKKFTTLIRILHHLIHLLLQAVQPLFNFLLLRVLFDQDVLSHQGRLDLFPHLFWFVMGLLGLMRFVKYQSQLLAGQNLGGQGMLQLVIIKCWGIVHIADDLFQLLPDLRQFNANFHTLFVLQILLHSTYQLHSCHQTTADQSEPTHKYLNTLPIPPCLIQFTHMLFSQFLDLFKVNIAPHIGQAYQIFNFVMCLLYGYLQLVRGRFGQDIGKYQLPRSDNALVETGQLAVCDGFQVEILQNFGVAVVVESYCQPLLGWHVARYLSLKIFSPPDSITILIILLLTVVIFLYIFTLHSTFQQKQVALPSASIVGPNILSI